MLSSLVCVNLIGILVVLFIVIKMVDDLNRNGVSFLFEQLNYFSVKLARLNVYLSIFCYSLILKEKLYHHF